VHCLRQETPTLASALASALFTLTEGNGPIKNVKDLHWPEIAGSNAAGCLDLCRYPGAEEPLRIIREAWKIMPLRWVIVVDEDCDVRDWTDVMWRVVLSSHPGRDIITVLGTRSGGAGRQSNGHVKQLPAPTRHRCDV